MAENARRRTIVIAVILLLLIALALLLTQCLPKRTSPPGTTPTPAPSPATAPVPVTTQASTAPADMQPTEVLTAATLTFPAQVTAGAAFAVAWTGPGNQGDFVTIVAPDAPAEQFANYRETSEGSSLELTAPIDAGTYEVRYVTDRTRTILGRGLIEVVAAGATLDAVAEVVRGSEFPVSWTGPDNHGDYLTVVLGDWPDEKYGFYTYTEKGSPLTLTAPIELGEYQLRYVSGQGHKVLARRPIKVIDATVTLDAPDETIAGALIQIAWTGPNNAGDYITVVAKDTADGQYGQYTSTASGSPLSLLMPIMAGDAELRYMTGQGGKVLARRAITINAATITLSAEKQAVAGSDVRITWTGPNNGGDYITIVPAATPDGQYADYTMTASGSPMTVKAPKTAGAAEIRYMTGQGNKVLARIAITITAP